MTAIFVTGTGTDVGKTFVSTGLIRHLRATGRRVGALKPVLSGFDRRDLAGSDAGRLAEALGIPPHPATIEAIAPLRFAAPLAADQAARAEERYLVFADVFAACRPALASGHDPLVIEGAGGVMSPIAEDATVLDLITALGCPALVVGGSYLGAISHMLTAVAVLEARGIPLAAAVISESAVASVSLAATHEAVARFLPGRTVLALARDATTCDPVFRALAGTCGRNG